MSISSSTSAAFAPSILPPTADARSATHWLLCGLGILALLVAFAPLEDLGTLLTVIVCSALGLLGLCLVRDEKERRTLMLLFIMAFGVRVVVTLLFYESGLASVLGGADDTGWLIWWKMSRLWSGWPGSYWFGATAADRMSFNPGEFPRSLAGIYTGDYALNRGVAYFSTYFYYLLDIRSQPALAVLNGFLNALTVVFICRLSRRFFSARAALFVAGIAILMPSFLLWSALTVKETWVILCEVALFDIVWQVSCERRIRYAVAYGLSFLLIMGLLWGIRFYAAGIVGMASIVAWLSFGARQPVRAVVLTLGLLGFCSFAGCVLNGTEERAGQAIKGQLTSAMEFRSAVSSGDPQFGTNSGVSLDYNLLTVDGLTMQLLVGAFYLLLSPFPWQVLSGRQFYVLPEILLWWGLFFGLILPGIGYTLRRQPRLFLALAAFLVPFVLLYAAMFGNIGLAHRQLTQLMPFLLLIAAAGYDWHREQKGRKQRNHHLARSRGATSEAGTMSQVGLAR